MFRIDDDFKNCLPELSGEEYTELEKDIVKNGVLSPIVIWSGTIVDGHNRYAICQAHHITNIPTKEMNFTSKDEALEWILRNQLGRRNLNDFQRNQIALKYEAVIAERMKERQVAGLKTGEKIPFRPNEPNGNEPTTKRKELAKIAGTSEGSIQRTKLIIDKGTPEQIARAEKGGKGNSMSAIAKEITQGLEKPKIELRRCKECGKEKAVSEFYPHHPGTCKECYNKRKTVRDVKGNVMKILPKYKDMTEEEVIGNLYDTDREIEYTDDDLKEELVAKIEDFKWSVQNCLKIHAELLKNEKSREKVLSNLSLLQTEIKKWKELYNYE